MTSRRSISVIPILRDEIDEYGNQVESEGPPRPAFCTREQLTSSEDIVDRDQQARSFRYFLRPEVVITGRDQIQDGDQRLKVIGEPELIQGQIGLSHHIELVAELIEG